MESEIGKELKDVAKHSAIFGTGNMLQQGVSILLLPIYVTLIPTADYGVLNLLLIGATMIGLVSKSAIGPAVFRSYYDYEESKSRQMVVTTALTYVATIAFVLTAVAWVFSDRVSYILTGETTHWRLARLVILTGGIASINDVALTVFRACKMSKRYMLISIIQLVISMIIVIALVVYRGKGIEGVVTGRLIGAAVASIASVWSIRSNLRGKLSLAELRKMLAYGVPHIPENVVAFLTNSGSRILLRMLVGPAGVGIYSLAFRIASIVQSALIVPFNLIAPATIFSMAKRKDSAVFYGKLFLNYILITGAVSVMASVLTEPVLSLFAQSDYVTSWKIVPFLTFALVAYGARGLVSIPLMLKRKTFWFPIAFLVGAVVNLGTMLVFVPVFGIAGAGMSLLLGDFTVCYLRNRFASRYMKQQLGWGKIAGLLAIFTGAILLGNSINSGVASLTLVIRLVTIGMVLVTLPRLLNITGAEDTALQKDIIRGILTKVKIIK